MEEQVEDHGKVLQNVAAWKNRRPSWQEKKEVFHNVAAWMNRQTIMTGDVLQNVAAWMNR